MKSPRTEQLQPGQLAPFFQRDSLAHGSFSIPERRPVHLQFRRFAGCPICNLHMHRFAARAAEIEAAGVTVAAVFHSPLEALRPYHRDLPFIVLGDPERSLYKKYGIERSMSSMLHPRAMTAGLRGMLQVASNPMGGDLLGLVADFLIDSHGRLMDVHYGKHADDHWSVDDVLLRLAR